MPLHEFPLSSGTSEELIAKVSFAFPPSLLKSLKSTPRRSNASYPCARRRSRLPRQRLRRQRRMLRRSRFNTSITGYQEIFTDPSYAGQIVVLTNPEIGNYGTNADDNEATRPYIEGLIVREFSRVSSNWRSQQVAEEYLEQFKIPVLAEIDSRALVRHLRDHGVMRGVISTIEMDAEKLIAKANSIP